MKKSKRYTGLLDDWIESQIEQSAQDPNVGFVETLYQTCSSIFLHLWRSRLRFMPYGPRRNTLKKDVAQLPLWEENFAPGHLDIILGQSSRLKTNVVENLKGIGEVLISHYVGSDDPMSNLQIESSSIQNLVKELRAHLDNAEIFLSTEEKSNSSSDEDTSDDSSSTTDGEMNRYGRLHSYVLCLMDLVPAIERHALCLQQRVTQPHEVSGNQFDISQSALPFAIRIRDRFTTAPVSLVERLAEANWERSVRIRKEGERKDEEGKRLSNAENRANEDDVTLFKPYSLFHDSAIGTSVFTRSQYAATAASHQSFLSTAEENGQGRPRVPHLTQEYGLPFKCEYCQRVVNMRNRIDWKLHVFADLQSYICTHAECKDTLKTFTSRDMWARHEINEHFSQSQWRCSHCRIPTTTKEDFIKHLTMAHNIALSGHPLQATIAEAEETVLKRDFKDHKCPLCFEFGWKDTKDYATHVGRHLEEISIPCLPRDDDCYGNGDSDADASSKATKDSSPPVRSATNNGHGSTVPFGYDFDFLQEWQDSDGTKNRGAGPAQGGGSNFLGSGVGQGNSDKLVKFWGLEEEQDMTRPEPLFFYDPPDQEPTEDHFYPGQVETIGSVGSSPTRPNGSSDDLLRDSLSTSREKKQIPMPKAHENDVREPDATPASPAAGSDLSSTDGLIIDLG
ncbi:uncharacterized protein N7484_000399 [Penicillium longicatenatum]|uniref:uncharacterized protein n=1 Tax=Penicillium longicatenatum TaxID=1561947 RepID=UPI002547D446|nr:uncharacterized protein N7484_000399 [Penicillium longicatenatum]KAJ5661027.1 hypothetical protein N7484_000399 [Penicillium longicatenatum]